MPETMPRSIRTVDPVGSVWDRAYSVAPLILVGTTEPDGSADIAPKHMAMPLGQEKHFGFVCTPRHRTYQNIRRDGEFTVTYPTPSQVVLASISASPPRPDDPQPSLAPLSLFPATTVKGSFVAGGYLFLECRLAQIIDGFGDASLIVGEIVAAHADDGALRSVDRDDADLVYDMPLLVFLGPDRYAVVHESTSFPFPVDFKH